MTKFKIFKEEIFILWELHSKILVGDTNLVEVQTVRTTTEDKISNNTTLNARLLARVVTECHYT
jgi:hypothetical protein